MSAFIHRSARTLLAGCVLAGALLGQSATAIAQDDVEVANEYRLTFFPSYPLAKHLAGFSYLGLVEKPDESYQYSSLYLGKGVNYWAKDWLQLWGGLIGIYTDDDDEPNSLEIRPFVGIKFFTSGKRGWTLYNWTRYEARIIQDRDTRDWDTIHRIRNQTKIEIPLAKYEKAWTPKTWYVAADIEPIWRSDTGEIDPLRIRTQVGWIPRSGLMVELQYYLQYTPVNGNGLQHTDNIIRLNFKIGRSMSALRRMWNPQLREDGEARKKGRDEELAED